VNNAILINPLLNNRFRESARAKSHERYGNDKIPTTIPDKYFYPLANERKPRIEEATDPPDGIIQSTAPFWRMVRACIFDPGSHVILMKHLANNCT
jgi:hypothetical protein